MYKLILSVNNLADYMVWPSVPAGFGLDQSQRNGTYEGIAGDYNTIGPMDLWKTSWEGVFPVGRRYLYMPPDASTDGWAYVEFIQKYRAQRIPFRITLLDSSGAVKLLAACTIDAFSWRVKKNGDIAYSMDIREYRFITQAVKG